MRWRNGTGLPQTQMKDTDRTQGALEAEDRGLVQALRTPRCAAAAGRAGRDDWSQMVSPQPPNGVAWPSRSRGGWRSRLAREDYGGPSPRRALARILAAIEADWLRRGCARRGAPELDRLRPFDARYQRQLLPALDGLREAQGRCESLAGQVARRVEDLAEDEARRSELEAAVAELPRPGGGAEAGGCAVQAADQAERRARQRARRRAAAVGRAGPAGGAPGAAPRSTGCAQRRDRRLRRAARGLRQEGHPGDDHRERHPRGRGGGEPAAPTA